MRLKYGSKLGAWEVKELLGKGGQARVYRGVKLTVDQQLHSAAIKTIVVDQSSQNFEVELLVQEHQMLASVESPFTPKELDSGVETFEDDGGKKRVYWFAMEMVNGLHLYDEVKQNGPLDYLEWLNLANDLLTSLRAPMLDHGIRDHLGEVLRRTGAIQQDAAHRHFFFVRPVREYDHRARIDVCTHKPRLSSAQVPIKPNQ